MNYNSNMNNRHGRRQSKFESLLISSREVILEKIQKLFQKMAIEGHIFGSLARGNSDAYSDIDIWFTFPDEDIEKVLRRFKRQVKEEDILNTLRGKEAYEKPSEERKRVQKEREQNNRRRMRMEDW